MNLAKNIASGTSDVISSGINSVRHAVTGTIGGIVQWTAGSIWKVLMKGGKLAAKGIASLPIIPLPK